MSLTPTITALFVLCLVPATASAAAAVTLRATRESQIIQNKQADIDNLSRMETQEDIARFARLKLLVPVADTTKSFYSHNIPNERRYLRPWTKTFLERFARDYHARFRRPLRITSMVRTEEHQRKLQGRNPNAAAPDGEKRSAHLTGACLDISKKGMTREQMRWVRQMLSSLKEKGDVFAIEEFTIPNFHIMVHRDYASSTAPESRDGG